jgi:hypothetical protein
MKYSKLSNYQIKKILRCFCLELTATQVAGQLGSTATPLKDIIPSSEKESSPTKSSKSGNSPAT